MYRKIRKIPTLLALTVLSLGIGLTVYFDSMVSGTTLKAKSLLNPADVHFTNISDNAMTVSFLTAEEASFVLEVTGNNKKMLVPDDLDTGGETKARLSHQFSLKNLTPSSEYKIKINKAVTLTQKTAPILKETADYQPVKGRLLDIEGKAKKDALVYLLIGQAAPLSGRTDQLGMFVIPLTNARTQDFLKRPVITAETLVQITAKAKSNEFTSATLNFKYSQTEKLILQLGKVYNFLAPQISIEPSTVNNILGSKVKKQNSLPLKAVDLTFPDKEAATTIDSRPDLSGVGIPGSKIKISIQSELQTAVITVKKDGSWSFRPEKELEPGTHTITIEGFDQNGNLITTSRTFVVLKSGEAVLGDATPSATIEVPTPTVSISVTPEPTLTPTLTPSPIPTDTPQPTPIISGPTAEPPRSGSGTVTATLVTLGITFVVIGIKFLGIL